MLWLVCRVLRGGLGGSFFDIRFSYPVFLVQLFCVYYMIWLFLFVAPVLLSAHSLFPHAYFSFSRISIKVLFGSPYVCFLLFHPRIGGRLFFLVCVFRVLLFYSHCLVAIWVLLFVLDIFARALYFCPRVFFRSVVCIAYVSVWKVRSGIMCLIPILGTTKYDTEFMDITQAQSQPALFV